MTGDNREQGVDFGPLAEDLESESYPMSHEELLDRYGDRELDLESGSTTVGEILAPEMEREYEDADSVRQAIFNMVGSDAVGRENYSDRASESASAQESEDESI